jgi:glycine/D-amino acid oxidase-like deaminating enzyme
VSELLGAADVAIIGAGLVGCATAYYLAKGGVDVASTRTSPTTGSTASGRRSK